MIYLLQDKPNISGLKLHTHLMDSNWDYKTYDALSDTDVKFASVCIYTHFVTKESLTLVSSSKSREVINKTIGFVIKDVTNSRRYWKDYIFNLGEFPTEI